MGARLLMPEPQGVTRSDELAGLLPGLLAGEARACERFVRETTPRALATARRYFSNEADALDALQDAYASAFRALSKFEGGSALTTWFHRIVVNACLMKLRARRRRPERALEDLLPRFKDDGHPEEFFRDWTPREESGIERDETRRIVRSCIEQLPEAYREIVLVRDIEGLDTGEAAALLGITENAVKTRLHRARQALRELLDQHLGGD